MRTSPSQTFSDSIVSTNRVLKYRVKFDINGTMTDISNYIKSMTSKRMAGENPIASFTAATATEYTIVLAVSTLDLGTSPVGKSITIELGFGNEYIKTFSGSCQRIKRLAGSQEVTITALDYALDLTRTRVATPTYENLNSALFIREIVELAGFTARVLPPVNMMFALDFDAESDAAITGHQTWVEDTFDNGVPNTVIYPNAWYTFSGKSAAWASSNFSGKRTVGSFTITNTTDENYYPSDMLINSKQLRVAENATARMSISAPSGYGGAYAMYPQVVKFGSTWNGHMYYGAFTPRPANSITTLEQKLWKSNGYWPQLKEALVHGDLGDPCVYYSDTGNSWTQSGTMPLQTRPTYSVATKLRYKDYDDHNKIKTHTMAKGSPRIGTFNTEATIFYKSPNLYCIWRAVRGSKEQWIYRYTSNGTTWSAARVWKTFTYGTHCAPRFAINGAGGVIHCWFVNRNMNYNRVYHTTVSAIGGTFGTTSSSNCGFPDLNRNTRDVWSINPIWDLNSNAGWVAGITTCKRNTNRGTPRVQVAHSANGNTWRNGPSAFSLISGRWDESGMTGLCLQLDLDDETGHAFDTWYSGVDSDGTQGCGKTDIYRNTNQIETSRPSGTPTGPVMWGELNVTRMIDGKTLANADTIWANDTVTSRTKKVAFGGYFSMPGSSAALLMEVNFGIDFKVCLYRNSSGQVCAKAYRYTGVTPSGSWGTGISTVTTSTTINTEKHVMCEMIHTGTFTSATVQLRIIIDGTQAAIGSAVSCRRLGVLSSVILCAAYSGSVHTNLSLSNTFPGATYDQLFVAGGYTSLPTTLPTAQYQLDKGLNRLPVAAYYGTNPWEEIKKVCESEMASVIYDESGVFQFYNRQHYTGNNLSVVKTLHPTSNMKNIGVTQDIADIRNLVRVVVRNQAKKKTSDIWSLDTIWEIPANSSRTFEIEIPGAVNACDIKPSTTAFGNGTRFRAAYVVGYSNGVPYNTKNGQDNSAGGAEAKISMSIVPLGQLITVTVTNNHATSNIIMVDGNGNPYFKIWGQNYTDSRYASAEGMIVEKSDATSIATYGAQELEINLEYMTDLASAESLAQYVLYRYRNGIIRIEDLEVVGDPLLEIGDRVRVMFEPFGVDKSYWIEKLDDALSPETGYTQNVTISLTDLEEWKS